MLSPNPGSDLVLDQVDQVNRTGWTGYQGRTVPGGSESGFLALGGFEVAESESGVRCGPGPGGPGEPDRVDRISGTDSSRRS